MGTDGKFHPADQAVVVLAVQARVPAAAAPALVNDLVGRPAESQEGQNFADRVRPGVLHIGHTFQHEVRGFLVFLGSTAGGHVPVNLPDQHLYCVQNGAHKVVICRHFAICCHAAAAAQLRQKFFVEDAAIAFLAYAADFSFSGCHAFSSFCLSPPIAVFGKQRFCLWRALCGLVHQVQNSLHKCVYIVLVFALGEHQ